MTTEAVTTEPINPEVLFAEGDSDCGACCEGRCLDAEFGGKIPPLVKLDIAGHAYVGSRYFIIRADRLKPFPADQDWLTTKSDVAWAVVPDEKPPATTRRFLAENIERFKLAGLSLHGVPDGDVVHVYADDDHVGWTKPTAAQSAITPGELELVREISIATGASLAHTAAVYRRLEVLRERDAPILRTHGGAELRVDL